MMDKFILGMLVGAVFTTALLSVAISDENKEAAKVGWIEIDSEIYTLRKADVVDAVER